jgi:MoxR-like ATPase
VPRATIAARRLLDEVEKAIVGKRDVLELVLAGLLADGHVLLDDVPGVAKTLMARSFAAAAGLDFSRVQFTPDLLPADITGATVLDLATSAPVFRRGPIFAQLVLADEVNRAPAKTQAALLEAMQERQTTADGDTHRLPAPSSSWPRRTPSSPKGPTRCPRRSSTGSSSGPPLATRPAEEVELLSRRLARRQDEVALEPVLNARRVRRDAGQPGGRTRRAEPPGVRGGPGHRHPAERPARGWREPPGSLALLKLSRAERPGPGRDFVTPDDMRAVAVPALAHRVVLRAEVWARQVSAEAVLQGIVDTVPAPELAVTVRATAAPRITRLPAARDGRLLPYAVLGLGGLGGALLGGEPALAVLSMPFLAALALGLRALGAQEVAVSFVLDEDQVMEGDEVRGRILVAWDGRLHGQLMLHRLAGVEPKDADPLSWPLMDESGRAEVTISLRATRWGRHPVAEAWVQLRAPFGLLAWTGAVHPGPILRVLPGTERLDRLLDPADSRAVWGAHRSRRIGDGHEFAELRPYQPGTGSGT